MLKISSDTAFMAEGSASSSRQPNSLLVSFSRRLKSLFSKAAELCRLCGAEVAVLVLSSSGNPSAFGHSSVDAVLHRYYLRQAESNSNNYYPPIMITCTGNGRVGAMSDKHRYQAQQIEVLKTRVRQAQSGEGSVMRELKAWIEKAWESCKTLEELESVKHKYLALLENVRNRLLPRSSFSASGQGNRVGTTTDYLISGTGFDETVPTAADFFQHPGRGDLGSQNDTSYSWEKFGNSSSEEGRAVADQADFGSGTTGNYNSGALVELPDKNLLNQCLVNGEFDDHGNLGIGMAGNNSSKFLQHPGESLTANYVLENINVRSRAVMGPSNDLPYNSTVNFGDPNCASSGYGEMDDDVFNCIDLDICRIQF